MAKKTNEEKLKLIEAHRTTKFAFDEFLNEFKSESDRASVIIGAARLDLCLYHLLQFYLLPNAGNQDDLLNGDSPLSSFSSRINICYRLGLIESKLARALHLVRKIRNIFAHETSGSSLDSGSHSDRVRELAASFIQVEEYIKFRDKHFSEFDGASRDFRAVVTILTIRLDTGVMYLEPLNDNDSISMFPGSFLKLENLGDENKMGSETD
jgi:hypothetical protein